MKTYKLNLLVFFILCSTNSFFSQNTPGGALDFDGINDQVNLGNSINTIFDPINQITIEAWVKPTTNNSFGVIVGNHWTPQIGMQFMLRRDFGRYSFYLSDNNGMHILNSGVSTVTLNTWQHIAAVWDGSQMRIYINGLLNSSLNGINGASFITISNSVTIGNNSTERFTGSIDEVRLWTVARSQCEINTFMNCEIPTPVPGLLANYHFNQGISGATNQTVTSLDDASGNGYHGSLLNMALTGTLSNWVAPGAVVSGFTAPSSQSIAVGSISSQSVVCQGDSVVLSGTGANSYSWTGGVLNNVAFTPTITSSYAVIGTNTLTQCSNFDVITIQVNPTPLVVADNGLICDVGSFTIAPTGANTFSISGGSFVVSPTVTSTYSIIGTSADGCISSNPGVVTVSVGMTPTITVNSGSICLGNTFAITPNGANTYTISGGNFIVSPTVSTVYTVVGKSAEGCPSFTSIASNVLVVNAMLPVVTVNNGTICIGNSFSINPTGALSYAYSSGTAIVNPIVTTVYTVTGTNSLGCYANTELTVVVNPLPTITVNSGAVCNNLGNGSFTIVPLGASSYTVSGGSFVVSPTANTNYSIVGTDINGCTSASMAICSVSVSNCQILSGCLGLQMPDTLDYINFPTPYYTFDKAITIEAWIYVNDTSNSRIWMSQGSVGLDDMINNQWLWHDSGINSFTWYVNENGTWNAINSSPISNGWHHVATIADTTGLYIYVDGVLDVSGSGLTSTIAANPNAELHVGHDVRYPFEAGRNGSMNISELRVWNVSRSQQQIQTYSASCLTNSTTGLVLYNKFEDGPGQNTTTSEVGPNGLLYNLNATTDWISGSSLECCYPIGSALKFDGLNDRVDLGNSMNATFDSLNVITLEAWVNPSTLNQNGTIIGNFTSSNQMQFLLRRTGNQFSFLVKEGATVKTVNSGAASATLNVWQHVAGVWNGNNIRIYIDGKLKGTTNNVNGSSFASCSNTLFVGSNFNSDPFSGSIDELRIWTVARNQCDLNRYKNCELNSNTNGLYGYYQFNQGFASLPNLTITSLIDSSGNSNIGTLTNFALTGSVSNWVTPGGVISGSTTPDSVLPVVMVTCKKNPICSGKKGKLTASGANSYLWNTGETTHKIKVSPTLTTTYTVVGVSTNGCFSEAVITQSVNICNDNDDDDDDDEKDDDDKSLGRTMSQLEDVKNEEELFLKSIAEELNIRIYPNPTNSNLTLNINKISNGMILRIYNVFGQLVREKEILKQMELVNTSELSSGVYVIRIFSHGDLVKQEKLIKTE